MILPDGKKSHRHMNELRKNISLLLGPDYMGRAGSFSELARLPSQLTCINKFNKF